MFSTLPPMRGEDLRNILKGLGKPMGNIARELGMTSQNLNIHLRKEEVPEYLLLMITDKLKVKFHNGKIAFNMVEEPVVKYEAMPLDITGMHIMYVPLVGENAYAGYLRGCNNPEYIDKLEKIPWLVDREYKGNYLSFVVRGDSMDDGSRNSYMAGDKLLCREVAPHLWNNSKLHIRDWDFVIATRQEGIVVKQIIEHDLNGKKLKLHSLNPQYEDYFVDLKDVLKVFNVVQVLRQKV